MKHVALVASVALGAALGALGHAALTRQAPREAVSLPPLSELGVSTMLVWQARRSAASVVQWARLLGPCRSPGC